MKLLPLKAAYVCSSILAIPIAIAENPPTIRFQAVGSPGFLTIEGRGATAKGKLQKTKSGSVEGAFLVDLKEFDTGIELRNSEMQQTYLEVEKYRYAHLRLNPVAIPNSGYFNWSGELSLHGVGNKINGVAFVQGSKIEAKFSVNTSDYKIKKPIHMGIGIEEKVNVIVSLDVPES